MTDEEIARKLYELELAEERGRKQDLEKDDEEYAKQLAVEFANDNSSSQRQQQRSSASSRSDQVELNYTNGAIVSMNPAVLTTNASTAVAIRLHNPSSGNYIGETFNASYTSQNGLQFELHGRHNVRMRVSDTGRIEYSNVFDTAAMYSIETIPDSSCVYILPVAHLNKPNMRGEPTWCLQLMSNGMFVGNGYRSTESQWLFVQVHPPTAAAHSTHGSRESSSSSHKTAINNLNSISSNHLSHVALVNSSVKSDTIQVPLYGQSIFELLNLGIYVPPSQQIEWLQSTAGKKYLYENADQRVIKIFERGELQSLMYRTDWLRASNRFKDYPNLIYHAPTLTKLNEKFPLSQRKEFFVQGYIILQKEVPSYLIQPALQLALSSIGRERELNSFKKASYGRVELSGPSDGFLASDSDFLALYYESYLNNFVQKLIGINEIAPPSKVRISMAFPTLVASDTNVNLSGSNWVVDGFSSNGDYSPCTLLVGVALTDMVCSYTGRLCVYDNSHVTLQEALRRQVHTKSSAFSSAHSNPEKTHLSDPTKLSLKAGDAFLMIPKLAYIYEPNSSQSITCLALFEICHTDHAVLKSAALDGLWVEFQGINEVEFANKPTKADLSRSTAASPRVVDYSAEHYSSSDTSMGDATISPIHNSITTHQTTNIDQRYSKLESFDT